MAASSPPSPVANDDNRLPWLDAGAARAAGTNLAAVKASSGSTGSGTRWLVSILIMALVAAGAFFLGRKDEAPPPMKRVPPLATTPLAPARPALEDVSATAPQATAPALARADAESVRQGAAPRPAPVLHLRPEQVRAVRRIAQAARVEVHRNTLPEALRQAYSPRVGAPGLVVQLGAYRTVAEAEAAAQKFRYKYRGLLEPLPKAVMPFRPKDSRRMFYRVQFVTPSQAYAEVTCQRLRAAEKTCIVVY